MSRLRFPTSSVSISTTLIQTPALMADPNPHLIKEVTTHGACHTICTFHCAPSFHLLWGKAVDVIADKEGNLERYLPGPTNAFPPSAVGIEWLSLAVRQSTIPVPTRYLSVAGDRQAPLHRSETHAAREVILPLQPPSPNNLRLLPSHHHIHQPTFNGQHPLVRRRRNTFDTVSFILFVFFTFPSYLVHLQPHLQLATTATFSQHVTLWEEESGCIQLHIRCQSHRQTGLVLSRSHDNTTRQRFLLRRTERADSPTNRCITHQATSTRASSTG